MADESPQQQQQMNAPSNSGQPDASQSGGVGGQPGMGHPSASQPGSMGQPGAAAPGTTSPNSSLIFITP